MFPAPTEFPNLRKEKQLARMLYGKQETARFAYKDAEENILGYVVRLENRQGTKITPTLTYCRNEKENSNGDGKVLVMIGLFMV